MRWTSPALKKNGKYVPHQENVIHFGITIGEEQLIQNKLLDYISSFLVSLSNKFIVTTLSNLNHELISEQTDDHSLMGKLTCILTDSCKKLSISFLASNVFSILNGKNVMSFIFFFLISIIYPVKKL